MRVGEVDVSVDGSGSAELLDGADVPVSGLQLVLVDGSSGRMLEVPLPASASVESAVDLARATVSEWVSVDYDGEVSQFAFQVSSLDQSDPLEGRIPVQEGTLTVSSEGVVSEPVLGGVDLEEFWSAAQERYVRETGVLGPDAFEAVLVAPVSPGVAAASAEAATADVEVEASPGSPRRRTMPAGVRARREQFSVDQSVDTPRYERSRSIDPPSR